MAPEKNSGLLARLLNVQTGSPEIFLSPMEADRLGLHAMDRATVHAAGREARAIVNVWDGFLPEGEVGFSRELTARLEAGSKGYLDQVRIHAAPRPESIGPLRNKLDGQTLSEDQIRAIVHDIASGDLSTVEVMAWASAIHIHGMDDRETVACIRAMVESGDRIRFDEGPVLDVHSIGGVPGNKYAPVAVSIVAAHGLKIPKTSSRAISSACGTADFMELFCPIAHDAAAIHNITENVGGTLCWGGGVSLAPADDLIIRVEYPLSLDPPSQLLASVLAKKLAVGAERVLIDIPTGPGAKVADEEDAEALARDFISIGREVGIDVRCIVTQGGHPLGHAIGPALEAREALRTLMGEGPDDVVEKATIVAGALLEMGDVCLAGQGPTMAREALDDGRALAKFRQIIEAQGGDPGVSPDRLVPGPEKFDMPIPHDGIVTSVDNRALVRVARALGSPQRKGAGIEVHVRPGDRVKEGHPLYTLYAEHENALHQGRLLAGRLRPYTIEGGQVLSRWP